MLVVIEVVVINEVLVVGDALVVVDVLERIDVGELVVVVVDATRQNIVLFPRRELFPEGMFIA